MQDMFDALSPHDTLCKINQPVIGYKDCQSMEVERKKTWVRDAASVLQGPSVQFGSVFYSIALMETVEGVRQVEP